MKRLGFLMTLFMISLLAIGCGSETSGGKVINGLKPSDVPVKFIQARLQKDEKTMYSLIEGKKDYLGLKKEQGPQNQEQIKNYRLTEWIFDSNTYYYKSEFIDPQENRLREDIFKVIKTKEGWKLDGYGDPPNFDEIVISLEKNKKILREMNDK